MITKFIDRLNDEIEKKINSGFLKEEYFTTWTYNYQSEVHSRMQALIVKICYDLGFDVELERGFNYNNQGKNKRFRPDVSVYEKNKLIGIIEYESTNSSDRRIYDREWGPSDLKYLDGYISDETKDIPKYWIIITTLPKRPVERKLWKSYEFNKSDDEFGKMIQSPFEYFFPTYIKEVNKILDKKQNATNVLFLNIDANKVELIFSNHS